MYIGNGNSQKNQEDELRRVCEYQLLEASHNSLRTIKTQPQKFPAVDNVSCSVCWEESQGVN